jgi:hypothetical protein
LGEELLLHLSYTGHKVSSVVKDLEVKLTFQPRVA